MIFNVEFSLYRYTSYVDYRYTSYVDIYGGSLAKNTLNYSRLACVRCHVAC